MTQIATYRVGDFDIAIISDGVFLQDAGAVMGVIPRVMWEPVIGREKVDADNRMELGLNCMVVRRGSDVFLADTGIGNKHTGAVKERMFPGDNGYLMRQLAELDLTPGDITAVANTHLHADHCGWNTVRQGDALVPAFPRARYFIAAGEYKAACHPNERTKGTYFPENFQPLEATGQLELVDGEREIIPGVVFLPTPGHTADHASLVLASNGETAIYTGDLVHHAVQIERAAWIPAFDILPLVTLETKKRLAERAIRERALLICTHTEYPGVGRLTETNGRRTFIPE